jgi:asparagine synthase (glutamine-hydrolysing)
MHFSLECRVPILYNNLIDFVESLDSRYKFNWNRGKIIYKDFAKEYSPSAIVKRKKIPFKSPTETWFRANVNDIEEILNNNNSEFGKLFNLNTNSSFLVQKEEHKEDSNFVLNDKTESLCS